MLGAQQLVELRAAHKLGPFGMVRALGNLLFSILANAAHVVPLRLCPGGSTLHLQCLRAYVAATSLRLVPALRGAGTTVNSKDESFCTCQQVFFCIISAEGSTRTSVHVNCSPLACTLQSRHFQVGPHL